MLTTDLILKELFVVSLQENHDDDLFSSEKIIREGDDLYYGCMGRLDFLFERA